MQDKWNGKEKEYLSEYLHNSSEYLSKSLKSYIVVAPMFSSLSSRSPIYLSFSLQKSFSTCRLFSKVTTRSLSFSASIVRITTLFLSISFSADKDLTKGSDVATFFSKSKSFPKMNRDSPKAYKEIFSQQKKSKKKKKRDEQQHIPTQAFACETTSPHWMTSPSKGSDCP